MILTTLISIVSLLPTLVTGPEVSLRRFEAATHTCGYGARDVVTVVFNGKPATMLPNKQLRPDARECAVKWMRAHPELRLEQVGG